MSSVGENAFDLLAQKDKKSSKSEKVEPAPVSNIILPLEPAQVQEGEESTWTVQSSAKTRKLVPQFTISSRDLGPDNARSKPSSSGEPVKKKVTRFTKDEMLALRKSSKMLSCMSDMLEVVSLTVLEPVCFERLEPEDVMRIWNAERNNQNKDNMGRGRGRLMGQNQAGGVQRREGEGNQESAPSGGGNDWNRGQAQSQSQQQQPAKKSLWDSGAANTLDLSDFAAAAAKFRAEMAGMKLDDGEGGAGGANEEDMMERLLREQNDSLLEGEELGGDMEDEDMPDWAADAEEDDDLTFGAVAPVAQQQQKRSILLEAMNVRSEQAASSVSSAAPAPKASAAFGGLDHLLGPSVTTPAAPARAQVAPAPVAVAPPAPAPPVVQQQPDPEWFYTDPQGQVQGPFSQENMHLWHEAGYFSKDLPIRQRHWMSFHPFFLVFPDLKYAFALNATEPPIIGFGMHLPHHIMQQEQMMIFERRRIEQAQYMEQQRQAQLLKEQQAREQAIREAQLREQAIREANERAALEAQRQALIKQQQDELSAIQNAQKQVFLNTMNRAAKSQPPPLVAREPTGAAAAMSLGQQQQQSAAAPVPLDSLKKIRISNIADLKGSEGGAGAQQQQQQQPSPDKRTKSSGPPPLERKEPAAGWANTPERGGAAPSMAAIQKAEQERAAAEQAAREEAAARNRPTKTGWAATTTPGKSGASLAEIQEEEARQREKARAAAEAQQPAAAPLTMSSQLKSLLGVKPSGALNSPQVVSPIRTSWVAGGAAAPVDSNSAVSLRAIMQQEERQTDGIAAPSAAGGASGKQRQGSSWASKAGTGVNASNLLPMPNQAPKPASRTVVAAEPTPSAAPAAPVAAAARPSNKSNADNFGGKGMSREMADWCRAQLVKLKGDDDLTLAEFCMTLESASDIRAYFSEVLGSSVQVANFASDFIKFKEGGRKAVDFSGSQSSGVVGKTNAGNNNNANNGFVNANKKKPNNANSAGKSPTPK